MKIVFKPGERYILAPGLTQWDYGQYLQIEGIERVGNVEIHFECGKEEEAIRRIPELKDEIIVKVPDKLLKIGKEITAYVYITNQESGRTIYTIDLPVERRKKPEGYEAPEDINLIEQIMEVLKRKADNLELEDGWLQLLSGKVKIGDRIRLPNNGGGSGTSREIELKNDGESICWRYTDSNEWTVLVTLDDLRGKDGETPEFELRENGHLYAVYKE